MRHHPILLAAFLHAAIAIALTGPALIGRASLGPERILDWDPLYRMGPAPPLPEFADYTPALLDLPRDLTFARGLREGRLDLWNPLSAAGAPLWAEQGGPFFPLKLPFYLAPSPATYHLFLALRLVAAGLGAFLLARFRGLGDPAALLAGATYEVSGAMIGFLPFGAASAPSVLPWVVLGGFAIAERGTLAAAVAAGAALGVVATTGHPTLILLVFAAFAASMAGHALASWRRPRRLARIGSLAALAGALGLSLAAPSLLPLAELTRHGATYKDQPLGARMREQSLQTARATVSSLLASAPFGTMPKTDIATNLAPCIGTLALYAAIAAVLAGRLHPALAVMAIFGVIMALAPPGSAFLRDLPGLRLILPTYAWAPVALALTQAAADGLGVLTGDRRARRGAIALGVLLGLSIALALVGPGRELRAARDLFDWLASAAFYPRLFPSLAAAAVLAFSIGVRRTRMDAAAPVALALWIACEPVWTMASFVLQPSSSVLSDAPSPAVRFLQERLSSSDARIVGVPFRVGHPLSPMLFGLPDLRGSSALPVRRYAEYMQALVGGATDLEQEVTTAKSPLLDLAAVRYAVLPAPFEATRDRLDLAILLFVRDRPAPGDSALPVVHDDGRVMIHENRDALARVRIVHSFAPLADEAAARSWASRFRGRKGSAANLGLADTVMLEPDERGRLPPAVSGSASPAEAARLIEADDPDRLLISARLENPAYVVVADTYYPGWKAWIDGVPTSIFPANLLFRAVRVPAGEHAIELRYAPLSFRHGSMLFAAASALSVWLAASRRARAALPRFDDAPGRRT